MRYDLDNHYDISPEISNRHHWIRGTDVQHVWRKYGWVPPSEYRRDFQMNSIKDLSDKAAARLTN
jgi:hypothetical protein